ncbi:MAG: sugar transferase [Clostridia bacterium]|nr:sugar transferase [Clostridia bacterium]
MLEEFLKTPAGHAVFGIVIAVAAIVIIELNYRLFFKYVLDFVFALIATVICSPVLLVGAIISHKRAGYALEETPYLGAKGKIIYIKSFAGINKGIKNLPRLLDILGGKLSFVGVSLLSLSDGALLDDAQLERFMTRPAIVNHLVLHGDENTTYEEAFALDARYCKKRELFTDIFIIVKRIVLAIRGDGKSFLGETAGQSYGEVLLKRGTITENDLTNARKNAEEALKKEEQRSEFKNRKYN